MKKTLQKGIAQLVILLVMGLLAVVLPLATKLVQQNQENRSQAAVTGTSCTKGSSNKCEAGTLFQCVDTITGVGESYKYKFYVNCTYGGCRTTTQCYECNSTKGCSSDKVCKNGACVTKPAPAPCTDLTYTAYGPCNSNGLKYRDKTGYLPPGCAGAVPYDKVKLSEKCDPSTPPPAKVNGQCSTRINNICINGNSIDTTDSSTEYKWNCISKNGGTTDYCSLAKPAPVPKTCTISGKTITVGQFACDGNTQVECMNTGQGYKPCGTNGCDGTTGKCKPAPVAPTTAPCECGTAMTSGTTYPSAPTSSLLCKRGINSTVTLNESTAKWSWRCTSTENLSVYCNAVSCSAGYKSDIGAVGSACTSPAGCTSGICVNNKCTSGILGSPCKSNSDCKDGNKCGYVAATLTSSTQCVYGGTGDYCNAGSQCDSGICSTANKCTTSSKKNNGEKCTASTECESGKCLKDYCINSSSECNSYGTTGSGCPAGKYCTWAGTSDIFKCTTNAAEIINGICGTANGKTFSSTPTSNLCTAGMATAVNKSGSVYSWGCNGSNGGANVTNCSAKYSGGGNPPGPTGVVPTAGPGPTGVGPTTSPNITGITLSPNPLNLKVGETGKIKVETIPAGLTASYQWETEKPDGANIAIVDMKGLVTGIKPGETYIIVKVKETEIEEKVRIVVTEPTVEPTVGPTPTNTPSVPCTGYSYIGGGEWGECIDKIQTRTVEKYLPEGCTGTPSEEAAISQPCGDDADASVSFKIAFAGIKPRAQCINEYLIPEEIKVKLDIANVPSNKHEDGTQTNFEETDETDSKGNRIFKVTSLTLDKSKFGSGNNFNYIRVKGPFHLKRRMCQDGQNQKLPESTVCDIDLKASNTQVYDFSEYTLLAGDIYNGTDGVINTLDLSYIKLRLNPGKKIDCGIDGDLNMDGVVNNFDLNLVKDALTERDDE